MHKCECHICQDITFFIIFINILFTHLVFSFLWIQHFIMGPLQFVHTEILNVTQKTNKIFPEINFYFRKNANGYESACMKCIM